MKKTILTLALLVSAVVGASAQTISMDQIEKYVKETYGKDFEAAAEKLSKEHPLTAEGVAFSQEFDVANFDASTLFGVIKSSDALYMGAVLYEDDEDGVLITQRIIENLAGYKGSTKTYTVNLAPISRYDYADGKLKITVSFDGYAVSEKKGGKAKMWTKIGSAAASVASSAVGVAAGAGAIRSLSGANAALKTVGAATSISNTADIAGTLIGLGADNVTEWKLEDCYPFNENDEHKKVGAKAFVLACTLGETIAERSGKRFNGDDWAEMHNNLSDKQKKKIQKIQDKAQKQLEAQQQATGVVESVGTTELEESEETPAE